MIPVILFHAGYQAFEGGFVGVDVFFVISGYLITTLILSEKQQGTFSLKNFYERRARRILPALFLVTVASVPLAYLLMSPKHLMEFARSIIGVATFSSNILFWYEEGYFATTSELKPLLHTWSLAVEEQFYIIFPLLMLLLWRTRTRVLWLAGIGLASFASALWATHHSAMAAFFLLPFRGWELILGALTATAMFEKWDENIPATLREVLGALGLCAVVVAIFLFDHGTMHPGWLTLVPTAGAALFILGAKEDSVVGRLMANRVCVSIGLMSYSLYLWHQPVFAYARYYTQSEPESVAKIGIIGAAAILGYLGWKLVETPLRDRQRVGSRSIWGVTIAFCTVLLSVGLYGYWKRGFPRRSLTVDMTYGQLFHKLRINYGLDVACAQEFTTKSECQTGNSEMLVWGDSFAMHLVAGLLASPDNQGMVQKTMSACGPVLDLAPIIDNVYNQVWAEECLSFNNQVAQWLAANKSRIRYVVLSSIFKHYTGPEAQYLLKNGLVSDDKALFFDRFHETIAYIRSLGIEPIVFSPPPSNIRQNTGGCLALSVIRGLPVDHCDFPDDEYRRMEQHVFDFLKRIESYVSVVWLSDDVCKQGLCRMRYGDVFLLRDGEHLSIEGSRFLGESMKFFERVVIQTSESRAKAASLR